MERSPAGEQPAASTVFSSDTPLARQLALAETAERKLDILKEHVRLASMWPYQPIVIRSTCGAFPPSRRIFTRWRIG
jgi:hypothetical protein